MVKRIHRNVSPVLINDQLIFSLLLDIEITMLTFNQYQEISAGQKVILGLISRINNKKIAL